ncbi:hypothetical protein AK812_SmicGene28317 [Symbiodinium microadriaticum]|uniref:Uncharacterized protein n=1 Tax=Symbiodinium microadriaticum TaxID=2951 RepID=A0A1Q9D4R5_SYMMI|nr:hypothetical protein AK812_SmicGene28317 [Symbiodinium microadriaticum]
MGSFSKEPVHIVLDKDANTVCKSLGRTNPANVFKSTSYSRIPGIISKLQRPGEQLQSSAHYAVSILTQALSTLEKWAPLGTQYQFAVFNLEDTAESIASACLEKWECQVGGFLQLRLARTALHLRQPSELEMPYLQQVLKRIRKAKSLGASHLAKLNEAVFNQSEEVAMNGPLVVKLLQAAERMERFDWPEAVEKIHGAYGMGKPLGSAIAWFWQLLRQPLQLLAAAGVTTRNQVFFNQEQIEKILGWIKEVVDGSGMLGQSTDSKSLEVENQRLRKELAKFQETDPDEVYPPRGEFEELRLEGSVRRKDDEHCETIASLPLNTCKVLLSCSVAVLPFTSSRSLQEQKFQKHPSQVEAPLNSILDCWQAVLRKHPDKGLYFQSPCKVKISPDPHNLPVLLSGNLAASKRCAQLRAAQMIKYDHDCQDKQWSHGLSIAVVVQDLYLAELNPVLPRIACPSQTCRAMSSSSASASNCNGLKEEYVAPDHACAYRRLIQRVLRRCADQVSILSFNGEMQQLLASCNIWVKLNRLVRQYRARAPSASLYVDTLDTTQSLQRHVLAFVKRFAGEQDVKRFTIKLAPCSGATGKRREHGESEWSGREGPVDHFAAHIQQDIAMLATAGYDVEEVAADGNCLFREGDFESYCGDLTAMHKTVSVDALPTIYGVRVATCAACNAVIVQVQGTKMSSTEVGSLGSSSTTIRLSHHEHGADAHFNILKPAGTPGRSKDWLDLTLCACTRPSLAQGGASSGGQVAKRSRSFKISWASSDLPAGGVGRPTEDESSGIPASPSSARRRRTMPDVASAEEDDGDAGSIPSHPSQVEDEDGSIGDRAFTEPVMPTMADVSEADIDMSECVSKILEGLRGDAFSIARDIGLNRLLKPDGIDHLIEQIRQQAFPLQSEEASELFRQGQLLSGPLAKQSGEPMLSYIARRKRWWSTLCELDPDIRLSEAMRANLLVELSGLSRQEQLMVKTAARSQTTDEFARVLVQHHSVVHMKERLLTEKERPNTQRTGYRPWSDRQQHQTPKFGYMGYGYEEFEVAEPDQGTIPEEDLQEAAYPALGSPPDDESWIDDEEVAMQLNAYTAVSEEIGVDDIDEDYAEAVQLAYAATNTLSTAKGKGKGKGKDKGGKGKSGGKLVKSNLTIADRKAKLQELKSKSRCLRCGVVGHWAGDAECRFKGNAKGAAGKPSAAPAQSGGVSKPAPPKPQAYMAVEESDEDEVVILSNSGSQAHGYMAMKASSTKTGKGSGVLAPRMRRSEASATMRDSPPPGSSTLFTFGQHRGLTYERVVHTYPGYVLWGQREKCPSKNLADFLAWVREYYVVKDSEPIEVTRRERPLSETPVPVLEQPAAPSTGGPAFYVTCRGGCKEFNKSGSNAYTDMRTCKKCGAVTKTKKEKPVIDQESNTLDFDLLRSIASRTSEESHNTSWEIASASAGGRSRSTRLLRSYKIPDPPVPLNVRVAAADRGLKKARIRPLKHSLQEQQRENTRHVGSHPRILHELSMHAEFIEHCRYILNVIIDCAHCGVQTVNLSIVCKSNRHRSVGAGYLLGELCRFVKGTAVSITHMEAAKTFPRMPFKSCKGRCVECTHSTVELWVDVQDILDGFIKKCRASGNVNSYCVLIAEPAAARAAGIESYAERFHRECLELEEEEAAAAEAEPAAPTAGAASSGTAAAMEVDDDSFVLPPDLAGAASAAPPTAEEVPSSTPSYASPTPKVHYDAGPVFKPPPAELLQQQAPIAPVIRPAVPPIPAGAPPPPTGPPTKAPAVDANKEYIGKLRAEKEALLAENGRLSRALRDTEEELAETRRHPRDAQFDSRRANRAERQLDDLRGRRSRSRRRSYSPRDRRGDDRDRRDYRDRRDDPEERRYRRDDSRDIDRGDFRRMDSRSRVRERSVRADSSSHFNKIGRTARWGRDTAPDAARARSPSPAPPAYPPPPEEVLSHEECLGAPRRNLSSAFTTWDAPGPTRPNIPAGGGTGKGGGKSGDGGHRPASYYDMPDRDNPHRPLSGREARDYFRTWTPSEWKEFRRLYPRPPGQGRIIQIDEEMRSIEIAGIDRTGDVGLGWNRSINFGAFPDGVLTEMYNILGQKETPAMWIGPYSPTQFRAGDRRHHQLCEKHDLKVTCITPHTSPSYAPVGKPKDINPIGHLYSHNDVENRDTVSWCYEGTVYPYGMTASSTPGEAGEAERSCPSAPTDEDAEVYIVLWQYPLAFASDTAPMDLTDREELSRALEDSPDSTAVSGAIAARAAGPPGDQDTDPEDEELISDAEMAKEIETVLTECVTAKNDLARHQGFSPAQHVLGKQPRMPGSITDESESFGTFHARHDETSPFYLRHRARAEAQRAFIHIDTSRKVAKALQRNAAPIDAEYSVGDLVIYRRDNVPGTSATVWSTVSRVIGREAENAYWLLHENVPVLVNARKMRPADEIEVAAHRVLTGEPVLPEAIINGPEQRYSDERTADPVTAPATPRPQVAVAPGTPASARTKYTCACPRYSNGATTTWYNDARRFVAGLSQR